MSRDSMRGFAAGLLFSTIIIGSYYYIEEDKQQDLTIEQLEEASTELGYELINKKEQSKESLTEEATDITIDDKVEISTSEPVPVTHSLTITNGMGSDDIALILFENSMIESSEDFEAFFKDNNLTKKIQIGEFELTKGMSFEEIAGIIAPKTQ